MTKLKCQSCGLPSYSASTAILTCPYCGVTINNTPAGEPASIPGTAGA